MRNARSSRRAGRFRWGGDEDRWVKGGLVLCLAALVSLAVIGVGGRPPGAGLDGFQREYERGWVRPHSGARSPLSRPAFGLPTAPHAMLA